MDQPPHHTDSNPDTAPPRRNGAGDVAGDLLAGVLAPFEGVRLLATHRGLWPYATFPLLLGLGWSVLVLIEHVVLPEASTWYWTALRWLLQGLFATGVVLIQVLIALSAPLLDWLSEQTEEAIGTLPQGPPFWQELFSFQFWTRAVRAITEAMKLLGFKLVLVVIGLALSWIPGVGPAVAYVLGGIATGLDFLDYPLARRDAGLKAKLDWGRDRWAATVAFGTMVFALISIPGVGGLMLAPCVIGGTNLVFQLGRVPGRLPRAYLDPGRGDID